MQIVGYLTIPEAVVAPTLQDKTVNITATETAQTETLEKDSGYDGLGEVTINVSAIPSDYVGSEIARRDSDDLTASGAAVSVPAGYYDEAASKSVQSGSATAPASVTGSSAAVSVGTGTITLSQTISVTPSVSAGYVESGTAGNSAISLTGAMSTWEGGNY
jgi:hypothetical protein